MNWEWPIVVYLWLAGMAGGAFFVTFLADLFGGEHFGGAKRVAAGLGIPAVILGVLMLLIDLGHPFRAWHLFVRFRLGSPMSMGSWLLLIWAVLAIVLSLIWWSDTSKAHRLGKKFDKVVNFLQGLKPLSRVLEWIEFILSVLLIAYTGVLLSAGSSPLWSNTIMLPALFVASAVATGIALVNLASAMGIGDIDSNLISKLCKASAAVGVIEILALSGLLLLMSSGGVSVVNAAETSSLSYVSDTAPLLTSVQELNNLLSGSLSFAFWVGVVLVGLVLPLGVEFSMILRGVEKPSRDVVVVLGLMVLLGGLILRSVVVFGGQI